MPRAGAPRLLAALGVLAVTAGIAGCSPGATPAPSAAAGAVTVSGAWIREPTAPGGPAAAYMTIANAFAEPDALLSASTSIAESVELHETSMDSSGMMGMHPIERLEIPANGSVTLEPGGYHFMLMGLADDALIAGGTIELELEFERAGTVVVEIVLPQG